MVKGQKTKMQILIKRLWHRRRFSIGRWLPNKLVRRTSKTLAFGALALVVGLGSFSFPTPNADAALPGTNWTQRSPGSAVKFWSDIASSADGTKLAVVGSDDYIYTSTDSGTTWTLRAPAGAGVTKRWQAIASSADGTKLVVTTQYDYIYTSTDSGVSWTMRQPDGANTYYWYSVASSADGMTLMAGAGANYVYISTDGGANWSPYAPAGAGRTQTWSSVAMSSDATVLFAGTANGYVYRSADSGATWSQLNPAGAPNYWSGIAVSSDASKVVAVARNDYVYTSINGGDDWTQNVVGGSTQSWAAAAASSDGSVMMVGASGGYIYVSTDSGSTWTQRDPASGSRNWAGIALSADGTKAAASALTDYVYTSLDTGTTWTQRDPVGATRNWQGMASSADGMTLMACAQGDYLYKSTDGGETWTQVRPIGSTTAAWSAIAMSNDGTKIIASDQYGGNLYTSNNGGATWTSHTVSGGAQNWWAVASSADGSQLVATSVGDSVYTSNDSGATWTARQLTPGSSYSWYGAAISADGSKIAVTSGGATGHIFISTDNGATWTQNNSAGAHAWYTITMSADGQRLMSGAGGDYVYISADGGATWTQRRPGGTGVTGNWRGIASSADGMRLLVSIPNGYVYTSVDGGVTWTQRDPAGGTRNWRAAASSANGSRLAVAAINDYIYTSGGSFLPTVDPSEISVAGGTVNLIGECSATSDVTFTSVVSEGNSAHAISGDGLVYSWGDNTYGQFGNGTTTASDVPVSADVTGVLAGKTITKIVRTDTAVLALGSDGRVYSWGDNTYGQLGNGNNTSSAVPVAVDTSGVLSGKMVLQLVTAGETVYALTSDGSVYAWGDNTFGQLGNNTTTNSNIPVAVDTSGPMSGKAIRQIAATDGTAYAVASDGTVYAWGLNDHGQLGNGGVTVSPTWTQRDPAGAGNVRYYHGAAMSADGNTIAVTAQYSSGGSVYISTDGGATWANRSTGLPAAINNQDIKMSADGQDLIVSIAGNYLWTSTNGGVSWTQQNPAGGTRTWRSLGMSPDGTKAIAVAANDYVYTGTFSGGVWSWTQRDPAGGTRNWQGTAISADGNKMWAGIDGGLVYFSIDGGATWTANSPRVTNAGSAAWGRIAMSADGTHVITGSKDNAGGEGWVYTTANAGTASPATWTQRNASGTYSAWFGMAISSDGTKMMAGKDANQGYVYTSADSGATWTGQSSLPSGDWRGLAMSADGSKMVAANFGSSTGTSGGYVYTYPTITGGGGSGNSSTPVAVDMSGALSGKTVQQISTGYETAYVVANGAVYAWGSGSDGQLGNGTSADSNLPVAVDMTGALSGKTVRTVSADDGIAFSIATDGTVTAWGSGPLGNGTSSNVPVSVNGALSGKVVTTIVSSGVSIYALAQDGTVYAWGDNTYGQVGDSTNNNAVTPVAVYTSGALSGKFVIGISASTAPSAYALASDGTLSAWGYNGNGELGDGTTTNTNQPTAVQQSSGITSIIINGIPASNITSPDGCTVSFTAPPNNPGTYDVTVNYADGTTITIPQSLTYVEPYILLYLYGDNNINADPFTNNGVGTTPLQATVVTNDTTGYTVSINSATNDTDLVCQESGRGSEVVPTMSGSGSNMSDDTWAYGLGTSIATPGTWNGMPTAATIFDSYNADTAGRTHYIYFGAKVTMSTQPCTSYQGDVMLTATTNWGSTP